MKGVAKHRRTEQQGRGFPLSLFLLLLLLVFPCVLPALAAAWTSPSGTVLDGPGFTLASLNVSRTLLAGGIDVGALITAVQAQLRLVQQSNAQLSAQLHAVQGTVTALEGELNTSETQLKALLTPTIVEAVAGNEQATVRWSLGSATVMAFFGGATCETDSLGGKQQCTVGGLTNGKTYTFTAQLTNTAGPGLVSASSNSVVPQLSCHALLEATAGDGGVVTASPANSDNCPSGKYVAGTLVTLTALPDAGFGVSWTGPAGGVADATQLTFALRMPDAAETVVAAFASCFPLTVDVMAGAGSAVIAAPSESAGCAAGSYLAGTAVTLKASPAAGWAFNGWSGTVSAGFGTSVWSFVMPGSAATQHASFS